MKNILVPEEDNGARLDRALARLMPDMGLRGRRRICELHLALVNGKSAAAVYKVRTGDTLTLCENTLELENKAHTDIPHLVRRTENMAFLYKPSNMHTQSLAGKPGKTLETALYGLLGCHARLMNRLDFCTSGIAAAALTCAGEAAYLAAQDAGQTEKRYLALLEGNMPHPMLADRGLFLKNRRRVLVEHERHSDTRRHTHIEPIAVMNAAHILTALGMPAYDNMPECITLAGCTIFKGARHQIRAHCAYLGFPLAGDARYGAITAVEGEERFFLHHGRLILPDTEALCLPPWLDALGEGAARLAMRWLKA